MDAEIKKEFGKVHESIEKLAISMATGFQQVDKRFAQVDDRFEQVDKRFDLLESEIKALRDETKTIRRELERLPDDIDATYSGTLNDLLERVSLIERTLSIAK